MRGAKECQHFALAMFDTLNNEQNRNKTDFNTLSFEELVALLAEEIDELLDEMRDKNWERIIPEAVDVANVLMFITCHARKQV